MKLLLDLGNSRVKWAWLEGDRLIDPGVLQYRGVPRPEVLANLPRLSVRADRSILVASVGDSDLTRAVLETVAGASSSMAIVAVTEAAATGVRNGYADPRQLGVDRWLSLLAVFARYRSAACVAGVGTAVTVDLLNADGAHQGGLIIPGLELMREALYGSTSGIPAAAQFAATAVGAGSGMARDTEAGIRAGCSRAIAALVDSCVNSFSETGGPRRLVLTGGGAPAIAPHLRSQAEFRPLLVLEGLALRYAGVLVADG